MNTRHQWIITTVSLILGLPTAKAAEPGEINGQVLDAAGKPVAGVKVSPYWLSDHGRWTTRTGRGTDAEGKFSFELGHVGGRLMTLDETQEHGAIATLDVENAEKPLILKLQPTTLVQAASTNKGLGYEIEQTYVSLSPQGTRMAAASHRGAPSFSLRLPPGDYAMAIGGADCQRISRQVVVSGEEPTMNLGTIDLKPTIIAKHYGKAPPAWHVTDARRVDPGATLADFKGKWVLLEFWGYW